MVIFCRKLLLVFFCLFGTYSVTGQENLNDFTYANIDAQRYAASVSQKVNHLSEKMDSKTEKILSNLQKQEEKVIKKLLSTKDSASAKLKLDECRQRYASLRTCISKPLEKGSHYIPKLDSLTTSLNFLSQLDPNEKLKDALSKTEILQEKFQVAEEVRNFIKDRKEKLTDYLTTLGKLDQLKKINKQVYYYSQQIKEYKEILKDSRKIEKKALEVLSKTKLFKDFMRKNSLLASMFRLPGSDNDLSSIAGLQTRAQVTSLIQQQIGPNGVQQLQQNMQSAQAQLNQLKSKIMAAGGGSSNDEMPDFKPNSQKTKSFLKRLEYGFNIQTQKASSFFPVTSDIALSLGYKPNDKSVIGIGAAYKVGLGTGWNNISISNQGIGIRTYIDIKLKGSFWISGGYEQNYRSGFQNIAQLSDLSGWQKSGLVGISKVIPIKTKFFKKTNIKLLWDFLSYQQIPRTQPILFRIGYTLK